jgi:hypothetical protein
MGKGRANDKGPRFGDLTVNSKWLDSATLTDDQRRQASALVGREDDAAVLLEMLGLTDD